MNGAPLPRLVARELKAGYGHQGLSPRLVVNGAKLEVLPGELVAILGPNGSGKTTLLKTCMGLLPSMGGSVELSGFPLAGLSARRRARLAAWVPQQSESAWSFSARELVAQGLYARLGPFASFGPGDRDAVDQALCTMDALEFADRPVNRLSGGEARRVLLARALAQDTPLLALDEPAAHLDPGRQVELLGILVRLASEGKAVLVSIHDVNAARRFASRVLLLDRAGTPCFGPVAEVLSPERLEAAYETEFLHVHHERFGPFVLPLARTKKGKRHE